MDLGIVFLTIVLVLFLAKISSVVFEKFGIPGLVGEILIGIAIANLVIGDWSFMKVLDLEDTTSINSQFFFVLAEMGVIFLLFSVGLEMRVCDLMKVGRTAFLVASLGVIFPFIFGFVLMLAYDGNMYHALFLGAAMVATSVGITAKVIKDLKVMNTKESRIIIGAAVIDDIIGMIVLAVVVGMAQSGSLDIISIGEIVLKAVIFVVAILFLCSKVVPRFDRWWRSRFIPRPCDINYTMLTVAIIVCFGSAYVADLIGLAPIIGAFLAGMLFADRAKEWGMYKGIESITTFLLPFFFVYVGMNVELGAISQDVLLLFAVVLILAIIGKHVGGALGAKMGDRSLDTNSLNIIGIGMIPRGEVGIIVAAMGLKIVVDGVQAVSQEMYVVVVLMSVVTTLIAPPLLSKLFRKKYPEEQDNGCETGRCEI